MIVADKADGQALGTEAAGTTDAMEIRVGVARQVVVDCQVDALDINTTTKDIGRNTDTLVELFEFLVALDAAKCIRLLKLWQYELFTYRSS